MIANFDFDRMVEYGIEQVDQKRTIPNPDYKTSTYQLRKVREKKSRLEARVFQQVKDMDAIGVGDLEKNMIKCGPLI